MGGEARWRRGVCIGGGGGGRGERREMGGAGGARRGAMAVVRWGWLGACELGWEGGWAIYGGKTSSPAAWACGSAWA